MLLAGIQDILRFITLLIVFILVLALTYFTTRWIANYQKTATITGNIEVVEIKRITNTKAIEIVRIGEEYFAIAVGKDEINLISKLEKDSLNLSKPEQISPKDSFKLVFNKIKNNSNNKDKQDLYPNKDEAEKLDED